MTFYAPVNPPETIELLVDEEAIRNAILEKDPEQLVEVFKTITRSIQDAYRDLVNALLVRPEYQRSDTQPQPAEGNFLVWFNTATSKYYLLYGDQGGVITMLGPVP